MNHTFKSLALTFVMSIGLLAGALHAEAQDRLSYPQSKAFRRVRQSLGDLRAKYKQSFGALDAAGTKAADVSAEQRSQLEPSAKELQKLFADIEKTVKDASLPRENKEVAPVLAEVLEIQSKFQTWQAALSGEAPEQAATPEPAPPAAPPAKLSYGQRKTLKRMQGRAADLEKKADSFQADYEGQGGGAGSYDESQLRHFRSQLAALRQLLSQNEQDAKGAGIGDTHPEAKPVFEKMSSVASRVDAWVKSLPEATAKPSAGTPGAGAGGADPAPKAPATPANEPAAGPAALTPRQRGQLDRVDQLYVDAFVKAYNDARKKIDGILKGLEGRTAAPAIWPVIESFLDPLDQKEKNLNDELARERLPAQNPEVQAVLAKVDAVKAEVAALRAELQRRKSGAAKTADLSNYPDHKKDFARADATAALYDKVSTHDWFEVLEAAFLIKLAEDFPDESINVSERSYDGPDPVALMARADADKKDLTEIYEKYKDYMNATGGSNSPVYEALDRAVRDLERHVTAVKKLIATHTERFESYAKDFRGELELKDASFEKIDGALGSLREWRQILAYKKARAAFHAAVVLRFKAHDAEAIAALEASASRIASDIDALIPMVSKRLLAGRLPPSEEYYKGSDREQLRAQAQRAWESSYPNEPLVKIVFGVTEFERKVTTTYDEGSGARQLHDMSVLQFYIIARLDEPVPGASGPVAIVYVGFVNRDNLAKTTSIGVHDRGKSYPSYEVMLDKVQ